MEDETRRGHGHTIRVKGKKGGEITFSVEGRIALDNIGVVMQAIKGLMDEMLPSKLTVDLSGLEYLDSAGALVLVEVENRARSASIPFRFANLSQETEGIMALLDRDAISMKPLVAGRGASGFIEEVGDVALGLSRDFVTFMTFLGELLIAVVYCVRHPRSLRWEDVFFYMKRAGVDGLPIVGLINLLLGFVIGIMASEQLSQYEFNVFLGSLVAIAMVKEFGPIMTAILVAGRSGSAFAAEIGTMKVNEEVDALVTMGFDPVRFLAVPKVLAMIIIVPVLTLYADFLGILGGLIVGVADLGLAPYTYFHEIPGSITIFDVLTSLVKTAVFALIISGIGCQKGFQARGGAEAVGKITTSAAVSAIFLIIIVDAAFAMVLKYLS
ncbi:MAG: MlaE family lipid ABC transporter permease subunit [Candidatus Sulfobium sp.]